MQVIVNRANNIETSHNFLEEVEDQVKIELERFKNRIGRIEVHFSDANGAKHGTDDRRCGMDARIAGLNQTVAVSHGASNLHVAFQGALTKLIASIEHAIGRREDGVKYDKHAEVFRNQEPVDVEGLRI